MRLFGRILATLLAGAMVCGAVAAPQQYALGVQTIRVGVVILDTAKPNTAVYGRSAAPFAFYNLDNAPGVKPVGWSLVNPHAPGVVTADMVNRWNEIKGGTDLPVVGAPITKRNAEYWSVYLSQASDSVLADYDVLLVNPTNNVSLNASERQRLTKFVDQGGVLWIDPSATTTADNADSFPLAFTEGTPSGAITQYANSFSSILSTPYQLSSQDLNVVNGTEAVPLNFMAPITFSGVLASADLPDQIGFYRYSGVSFLNGNPTIAIGKIGDGEIIVTTQAVSQILGRASGTGPFSNPQGLPVNNSFSAASPFLEADGVSAAKLAVNMISELGSFSQFGGGARKTGSNRIDVTAPVLARWSQESAVSNQIITPPVQYKGVTVASTGSTITVYKTNPGMDLDGDGDTDDGIINLGTGAVDNNLRDSSKGAPYDIIWTGTGTSGTSMVAPLSSPVCAEVPDGVNGVTDVVMVVDSTGSLFVYDLFKKNGNGQLYGGIRPAMYSLSPPTSGYGYENAPNAPTVSGDLAFVADATQMGASPFGRVWVADLSSGTRLRSTTDFCVGGGNTIGNNNLAGYTASPTVGDVPIKNNSGGYDRIVYAAGTTNLNGNLNPVLDSVWFGAKAEPPISYAVVGSTLTVVTRAAQLNADGSPNGKPAASIFFPSGGSIAQRSLGPRITLLNANNDAIDPSTILTSGPTDLGFGQVSYQVNGNFSTQVSGVRMDYTIDWGRDPITDSGAELRGHVQFPMPNGITGLNRRALGSPALSPQGTICMIVADPSSTSSDSGGSLWWLKESSFGLFSVTGRWALYPSHQIPMSPVGASSGPVFEDSDPLTAIISANFAPIGADMSSFHWTGPPSILNGQVFATARAMKGGIVPVTVAMAFAADPAAPQIQAGNFPLNFMLRQPDFDTSAPGSLSVPSSNSVLTSGSYSFDQTSGTMLLTNLAQGPINGQIGNCLSLSQPLIIQGGTESLVQPDLVGGDTWSPLHWYCVYNGTAAQGAPVVTGNTLFFAANSVLANVLTGTSFSSSAVVNAMDATISPNDTYVVHSVAGGTKLVRNWQNQVAQALTSPTFSADPHIRMPSSTGVATFSDYQTRLIQQTLGSSTRVGGVVGGGTDLTAWGNAGVYGLSRGDFVVCDEGRVVRTDSNGNITFSSNANLNTGPGGGSMAGNVTPLVRPSRAYSLSTSEMLVVDPGANRVIKTNSAGGEERAVDHFILDPGYPPLGFVANEPRTFSAPQDALTYSNYVYLASGQQQVTSQQPVEFWVHYLVADSGNHRLIEVIDRYSVDASGRVGSIISLNEPDPNASPGTGASVPSTSVPQVGVLLWQSPANVSGNMFAYNSVTRLYLWQASGSGRYIYIAGMGNTQPARASSGLDTANNLTPRQTSTGNGGVVIFDPASPSGIQVYNSFDMPDLTTTQFWSGGTWQASTRPAIPGRPLGSLRSVSARSIVNSSGNGAVALMISEASGVYEFYVDPTASNTTGDLGTPSWFINNAAYTALRGGGSTSNPLQFLPSYAKRLDSGDVLLVNAYVGKDMSYSPFKGEVILLNGVIDTSSNGLNGEFQLGKQNLGFTIRSLKFNLPPVSNGVRNIVAPIFADRR